MRSTFRKHVWCQSGPALWPAWMSSKAPLFGRRQDSRWSRQAMLSCRGNSVSTSMRTPQGLSPRLTETPASSAFSTG